MSRPGKSAGFGMFLILLLVSTVLAGIAQALLSGIIILTLGLGGFNNFIVSIIIGIIMFVLSWLVMYMLFFKGKTFR